MTTPIAEGTGGTGHGFGTAPVFLASISTILGAVMFLRFGFAVGQVGLLGTVGLIVVGHLVTIPTALAIAEIATNRRVEGGGEYFIISRSFGATIGGAIGISLYVSQAVSVAFYMIAFAEAFRPLAPFLESVTGFGFDPRVISLPATVGLAGVVLTKGADLGVKALWIVVGILAMSLVLFFLGGPIDGVEQSDMGMFAAVDNPVPFIVVFAIVFPAFTGMTAGVGLSGDLANPGKSIPLGVTSATLVGMVVYVLIAVKMAASAPPDALAGDQLIMSRIALWGPIIPIGLAAATVSSAIGSILVAPRTLQALGGDTVFPTARVNSFLSSGTGSSNEPRNATIVTAAIAIVTVAMGNIDAVARIISMFFMLTYGALCSISALEHFAARPSYRPSFRSKWYLSLIGAVMSFGLMLQMDPVYAILAVSIMIVLYRVIRSQRGGDDLAAIFTGVLTQATRFSQVKLQADVGNRTNDEWRPAVVMVNDRTFRRSAPIQFFTWLTHRYGVGTYLHYVEGDLDRETYQESRQHLERLVQMMQARRSAIYVDTLISPSKVSAIAQSLQVPGISGMENNCLLMEFSPDDEPAILEEVMTGVRLASAGSVNSLVLRHAEHFFGQRGLIDVWLTLHDYRNANLMILLAYILLGHQDWERGQIRIFAAFPRTNMDERQQELHDMIHSGRLPISAKNLRIFALDDNIDLEGLVRSKSADSDLVMFGLNESRLHERGPDYLLRHAEIRDALFVGAEERILIE